MIYNISGLTVSTRLFLLIIFFSISLSSHAKEAGRIVAHVGETAITERDVGYRVNIAEAYGNEGMAPGTALVSLVNDAIEREVARANGVIVTSEELDSLSGHADRNTKAPEILARVKSAFGDDTSSYRRIYLSPRIINRKLRNFYSRDLEIHVSQRALIERAYGLVVAGKSFEDAASESGLEYSKFDIGGKAADTPPELKRYFPGDEGSKDPLAEVLETLSPGEVYKNIVEDDNSYKVLRLKEKNGDVYSVEAIIARKKPFDGWFGQEAEKLSIRITDPELKESIASEYPNLWWVKSKSKSD